MFFLLLHLFCLFVLLLVWIVARGSLPTELGNSPQTRSGTSGSIRLCHRCHPDISTAGLWSSSTTSSLWSLELTSRSWETLGQIVTRGVAVNDQKTHMHKLYALLPLTFLVYDCTAENQINARRLQRRCNLHAVDNI